MESKVENVEREISKLDEIKADILSLKNDVKWIKWALVAIAAGLAGDGALVSKLVGALPAAAQQFAQWIR